MTCEIRRQLATGTDRTACESCGKAVFSGRLNLTSVLFPGLAQWVCRECLDRLVYDAWRRERMSL